jgi:hypothetical protein
VVTSTISFYLINPQNAAPLEGSDTFSEEVANRFPHFVRMLGAFYCVTGVLGLAMIVEPVQGGKGESERKEVEQKNHNSEGHLSEPIIDALEHSAQTAKAPKEQEVRGITMQDIRDCFKDVLFIKLSLVKIMTFVGLHYFMYSYKRIGLTYLPQADKALNIIGNCASCTNAISRCFGGILYERTSFLKTQLLITVILSLALLSMIYTTTSFIGYGLCVGLCYMAYGIFISSYPVIFEDAFGKLSGLKISLACSMAFSLGCIIMSTASGPIENIIGKEHVSKVFVLFPLLPVVWLPWIQRSIDKNKEDKPEIASKSPKSPSTDNSIIEEVEVREASK